jgi:hypothetical protein
MRTATKWGSFTFALLLAIAGQEGRAGIVFDNLDQAVGGQDDNLITNAGNMFTTGATPEGLKDVVLLLNGDLGGFLVDVGLFSSEGGSPGSELVSFGSVTPAFAGDNPYAVTPQTQFILAADTQYFLLVTYGGSPVLDFTISTAYSGSGTLDGVAQSGDGGSKYFFAPLDFGPYQMRVDVASVPEPSSLAMCGIAVVTGLFVARVRRQRRA